jgi:ankyrin repeat protein
MPNRVGANGASISPGKSGESAVYLRISGNKSGLQMPPAGPLGPEQINAIKVWIDQGAEWPDEFAGEAPPRVPDPQASRLMEALRKGDRPAFERMLRADPKAVNQYGPGGSTPLMYAALYGDSNSVRLLLEQGADPNLANDNHATALMYAVDDAEKIRLLLDHGANANARSDDGQTALLIAATRPGSSTAVQTLLDHGADLSATDSSGLGVLARAVSSADEALIKLVLDRGVNAKPLPLPRALRSGCMPCFDLLMKAADASDLPRALAPAAESGDLRTIEMLLNRGVKANGAILVSAALSPEPLRVDLGKTLIEHGADINANAPFDGTVLDFAKRQGDTPLVDLLIKSGARAGASSDRPVPQPKPAGSARAAVERSIPVLQRADVAFIKKAGCVSCHNNSLTAMTMVEARKSGIRVDEQIARAQLKAIASYLDVNRERALQNLGLPGVWDTVGYILLGMTAEMYPADENTEAWARYLKNTQLQDGHWYSVGPRPPLEAGNFQTTATAMRAIQIYAPKSKRTEYEQAVHRTADWLAKAQPRDTEDRVFQLLGLQWGGGNREVMRKAAQELLAQQRSDGGWSQLSTLASDAYATGEALMALNESGALKVSDAAYQRGVRFLLNAQLEDGSWYVRSRTRPIQPDFDSDFPHGRSQFISAAATNWAAMALARAAR